MNNNKQLTHYLESRLKVKVDGHSGYHNLVGVVNNAAVLPYRNGHVSLDAIYPLMYPLSALTETINHYGLEQIILLELAKIEGTYKGEEYEIKKNKNVMWIVFNSIDNSDRVTFGYDISYNSFYKKIECKPYHLRNQLLLFNCLDKMCINHRDIENTIDPRSLGENNPYLIKSNIMQTNEQTTDIASMSEVVAKYMGWERIPQKDLDYWRIDDCFKCFVGNECFNSDWNRIHEVWEKVGQFNVDYLSDCWDWSDRKSAIEKSVLSHNKLEAFTALFNAIQFINNLKQENGNSSI